MSLSVKNMLGGSGKLDITNGKIVSYEAREDIPKNTFVQVKSDNAKDDFLGHTVPCGMCEILPNKYLFLSNHGSGGSYAGVRIYDATENGLTMTKEVGYFFDFATCCGYFVTLKKIADGVAIAFLDWASNQYTYAVIIMVDSDNNLSFKNPTMISASRYSGDYIAVCEIDRGCYLVSPDTVNQVFKITVAEDTYAITVATPSTINISGKKKIIDIGGGKYLVMSTTVSPINYQIISATRNTDVTTETAKLSISQSPSFYNNLTMDMLYYKGKIVITGCVSTRNMHRIAVYDFDLNTYDISNMVLTDLRTEFLYDNSSLGVYGNSLLIGIASGNSQYALTEVVVNDDKSVTIESIDDAFIKESYTVNSVYATSVVSIGDVCFAFYRIYTGSENRIHMIAKGKTGIVVATSGIYGIALKNIPTGMVGDVVTLN